MRSPEDIIKLVDYNVYVQDWKLCKCQHEYDILESQLFLAGVFYAESKKTPRYKISESNLLRRSKRIIDKLRKCKNLRCIHKFQLENSFLIYQSSDDLSAVSYMIERETRIIVSNMNDHAKKRGCFYPNLCWGCFLNE